MCVHLLIFGAGGHAKVASDCGRVEYPRQIMLSGDEAKGRWCDVPIIPQREKPLLEWKAVCPNAFVAIGDADIRERVTLALEAAGFVLVTLIHSSAVVSPSAKLEAGTLVCQRAVINADAHVGKGCIVNTGAIVEHDCKVGDFSHVSPGAILGGGVVLGEHCRICLGACISDHMEIGGHATVGAGAAVLSAVPECVLVAGVPARIHKHYPAVRR
jgi:acetyltransferase EpsM